MHGIGLEGLFMDVNYTRQRIFDRIQLGVKCGRFKSIRPSVDVAAMDGSPCSGCIASPEP